MMQAAFDRPQCGFFNAFSPNDGDPSPDHNRRTGKARKIRTRRDTDSESDSTDENTPNYDDMTVEQWNEV